MFAYLRQYRNIKMSKIYNILNVGDLISVKNAAPSFVKLVLGSFKLFFFSVSVVEKSVSKSEIHGMLANNRSNTS